MINVSELIGDKDFTQPNGISVARTSYTVVNHQQVKTTTDISLTGIITISSPRDIEMLPEYDRNSEAISIFTYKKLYTTGYESEDGLVKYLSDVVTFEGSKYEVRSCMNDSQYGFCKSIAVKMEQAVN